MALPAPAVAWERAIGMQTEPRMMDPPFNQSGSAGSASSEAHGTLPSRDPDLQIRSSLAGSFGALHGTTGDFGPSPGVRFHDGSPLTAEHLKLTADRVSRLAINPGPGTAFVDPIPAFETIRMGPANRVRVIPGAEDEARVTHGQPA
ncbi:hypothetical protein ACE7GA_22155 [Roseomonas sp. CCTCC AB2023176]|uniref:hypothetical protein n=1 Tax=Roseomonas sp. CCTCC AB2023176 TaxID=3342640 RepID=UPI0035DF8204